MVRIMTGEAEAARDKDETLENWREPPMPEAEVMTGRYASLEPLQVVFHSEELHTANKADPRIWTYLPYGPFERLSLYQNWIVDVTEGRDPRFYAIKNLDTGRYEGVASFLRIKPASGSIEVGHINFSAQLQGTRAATDAMFQMMSWAFQAGYRRYEWKCNARNMASRRAASRLGLSYEGIFRQATICKGRNRDTAWFAAINKEWPALYEAFETWLDPRNFDSSGKQRQSLRGLTAPLLAATDAAQEILE